MSDTPVRVRFAPSPTGHLHVSLVGSLIFEASGNFIGAELDHTVGNVSCDPI